MNWNLDWGSFNNAFERNNPGDQFNQGWKQADATRKANALQAAQTQYALNPNDPSSINALAVVDPATALAARNDMSKRADAKTEERTKVFGQAAAMAKTPEQWDAIADQLVANGYPEAASVKGKFSPEMRMAYMAAGGVKDEAAQQPTSFMRDAGAAGYMPGTPGFKKAFDTRNNVGMVSDGAGGYTIVDKSAFVGAGGASVPNSAPGKGAGPPAVLTDDDWETGGAGSQGPGNFR